MADSERHAAAMKKVARLVSVRERSEAELSDRLSRCGFSPEETRDAVETSVRIGLVDDRRFASAFIRGKTLTGWGRARIIAGLRRAGIDEETIESCSEDFASPDQELENARREIAKRPVRSKDPYASLMRRLVSKGYAPKLANRVVREFLSGADDRHGPS